MAEKVTRLNMSQEDTPILVLILLLKQQFPCLQVKTSLRLGLQQLGSVADLRTIEALAESVIVARDGSSGC